VSADPVQLFDRLAPPPNWSARTDVDTDPVAARILDQVFADTGNVVSLDAARRRRRTLGGAIVVAAIVAGGAVAAIWNRSPQEATRVTCWSEAVVPPDESSDVRWDGMADPATLCASEWSTGRFAEAAPPADLHVCVTNDDAAAVIPGEPGVCDALGFADFSPIVDEPLLAVNRAAAELDQLFNHKTCRPAAETEDEIRKVLDQNGLSGWTVTIAGTTSADETCATVFLEPEMATAIVIPVPQQP